MRATSPWRSPLLLLLSLLPASALLAGPPAPPAPAAEAPPVEVSPEAAAAAARAFLDVSRVLQHPRCMNCHPQGDAPLQTDDSRPHAMGVTRFSPEKGLPCDTCHRAEGIDGPNLPPANPHWHMPPAEQIFEGLSPAELCVRMNDPAFTGGRDLPALLEHVTHDALVLYGWNPGGGRTTPPLSHAEFVAAFTTWVEGGGACPEPS